MQGRSFCSSEGNKLIEKIDKALETSRIMKDVECFSHLDRYTGSEDGEKAAERIAKRMEELGIPVEREIYQVYRSLPGEASIRIQGDSSEAIVPLTPYVYSGTAENLEAELVFDRISATGGCSQKEQRARMAEFAGKIVLTYENSFAFACEAKRGMRIWHTMERLEVYGEHLSRRIWLVIIREFRLWKSQRVQERNCRKNWKKVH